MGMLCSSNSCRCCSSASSIKKRNKVHPINGIIEGGCYKNRIELFRHELSQLQKDVKSAETQKSEKEEELWKIHEQHKKELEEQSQMVLFLMQQAQTTHSEAEKELQIIIQKLEEERNCATEELRKEYEKLKQIEIGFTDSTNQAVSDEINPETHLLDKESKCSLQIEGKADLCGGNDHFISIVKLQKDKIYELESAQKQLENQIEQHKYYQSAFIDELTNSSSSNAEQIQKSFFINKEKYYLEDIGLVEKLQKHHTFIEKLKI